MITRKDVLTNLSSLAIGFVLGAGTAQIDLVPEPDIAREVEPAREADSADLEPCDDSSDSTGSGPDFGREILRIPSYCETFPTRCNIQAPCPDPTILADGSKVGGCVQAMYVCCSDSAGCWAIGSPTQCTDWLYWSDCEAGESAIDPVSGLAIIICHD